MNPDRRSRAVTVAALALLCTGAVTVASGGLGGAGPQSHRVTTSATPTTVAPATTTTTRTPASTTTTTTTTAATSPPATAAPDSTTSPSTAHPGPAPPPEVTAAQSPACPSGGCVTLDATKPIEAVDHAGEGFNLLPSSDTNSTQLRRLGATMYRSMPAIGTAGLFDWGSWSAAASAGAHTTLILSNLWAAAHPNGPPPTPWSNWSNYGSWVHSTVQNIVNSGQRVDYWDVYNEPGWTGYYSQADFDSMTPDDLLQQFLVTYQIIKSISPRAAIVGPCIGDWTLTPMDPRNQLTHEPDLTTFLRFAAAHGLQLAAVGWHHNGEPPDVIYSEAEQTWALIHSLPGLGHPAMFLDEYGYTPTQSIPGWDVGNLSAITRAGISSAERSCWDTCTLATLDGLLTDSGQPTSDYYVRSTYAQMSGQMISSNTSTPTLAGVGSVDSGAGRVVALVGRLQSCAVESWCQAHWPPSSSPAPPADVKVSLVLPWVTSHPDVHLSYEAFQPSQAVSGPTPATPGALSVVPAGAGSTEVTFTISNFADGAAYNVTVTPGS